MGTLVVLPADPGNQLRIPLEYLFNIRGRCNDNQIGLVNCIDAAMGLDKNIICAFDGLSVRRGYADVKKRGWRRIAHTVPEPSRLVQDIHGTKNRGGQRVIKSENSDFFHCSPINNGKMPISPFIMALIG